MEYDVIIVGAGPGGSVTSLFLADKGIKTLLVDKQTFPRDKICGDALSGKSREVLEKLGLEKKIEKVPHAISTGVLFSSPKGDIAEIPFKDTEGNIVPGFICERMILDNLLFQEAKKKVDTMEGFEVTGLIKEGDKVIGIKGKDKEGKEKEFKAHIVIGADGVYSSVAKEVGAFESDPEHMCSSVRAYYENVKGVTNNIELHFVDSVIPGYFWIFPIAGNKANVGLGIVDDEIMKRKVNLAKLQEDVINNHPMFKERFKDAKQVTPIKGWKLAFGSKRRQSYGNGWALIGDAAALIDPFTGEGMGNAIYSGMLISDTIEKMKQNNWDMNILQEYENKIQKNLDPDLKQSYQMQKLGKHTFLLNYIIGRAAHSDTVREYISKSITGAESKENYSNPMFYLKLLFI